LDKVMRFSIFILALYLFWLAKELSQGDKSVSAGLTYAAAVICLIFVFLARFKRFEGLGIKAEMWEDKMKEAEQLVDKM
jgi:hypothetical protein